MKDKGGLWDNATKTRHDTLTHGFRDHCEWHAYNALSSYCYLELVFVMTIKHVNEKTDNEKTVRTIALREHDDNRYIDKEKRCGM